MHEKYTTNNIEIKKRAKLGQNISKTLTYKHDLATKFNQINVKAVSMPPKFFQQLLMIESIYFCPSKLNPTQKYLHKSTQQQAMNILQWTTHEMSKPLRIFHNF